MLSVLFALLSAFSNAITAVLQRLASVSQPDDDDGWRRTALALVRDPRWLLGLLFMGGTFVFQAVALYFGQLAVVQPVLVTELIFTLALRQFWLRDVDPAQDVECRGHDLRRPGRVPPGGPSRGGAPRGHGR